MLATGLLLFYLLALSYQKEGAEALMLASHWPIPIYPYHCLTSLHPWLAKDVLTLACERYILHRIMAGNGL